VYLEWALNSSLHAAEILGLRSSVSSTELKSSSTYNYTGNYVLVLLHKNTRSYMQTTRPTNLSIIFEGYASTHFLTGITTYCSSLSPVVYCQATR
jgi:hypothetical protein